MKTTILSFFAIIIISLASCKKEETKWVIHTKGYDKVYYNAGDIHPNGDTVGNGVIALKETLYVNTKEVFIGTKQQVEDEVRNKRIWLYNEDDDIKITYYLKIL